MTERVDVEGLRALEAKATPVPWTSIGGGGIQMDGFRDGYRIEGPHDGGRWPRVCDLRNGPSRNIAFDNAELIVALRNAAPSLLAEVAALRAENERMQRAMESRDLICEALQRELGPERTLRSLGLDPARVAQSRREISEGKTVSLDELRAALAAQEPR